ncbi:hypothetical protein CSE45_4287 [Citreicella sp. SE45]|nr:hypothetical protein CSE45_4287 [Citreicella sp. SE45]
MLHGASRAGSNFKAPCASAGHRRCAVPGGQQRRRKAPHTLPEGNDAVGVQRIGAGARILTASVCRMRRTH